jgi:hypothetical protein
MKDYPMLILTLNCSENVSTIASPFDYAHGVNPRDPENLITNINYND